MIGSILVKINGGIVYTITVIGELLLDIGRKQLNQLVKVTVQRRIEA